jgi:HTH-type transcriptional regulator/antitoxin HigA
MNVLAYKTIEKFWTKYADSKLPLQTWYFVCRKKEWKSFNELCKDFPDAFPAGDSRVVFDIKASKYRLVARVLFDCKQVQIKWMGTHAQYDKIDVRTIQKKNNEKMSNWSILTTEAEYKKAQDRVEALSETPPAVTSALGKELMLLGYLIQKYEDEHFAIEFPHPIAAIKQRMNQLNLKVSDLLDIFGDRGTASKVLNGQRSLSINMVRQLSQKLSLPTDLLIRTEKSYRFRALHPVVADKQERYSKRKKSRKD